MDSKKNSILVEVQTQLRKLKYIIEQIKQRAKFDPRRKRIELLTMPDSKIEEMKGQKCAEEIEKTLYEEYGSMVKGRIPFPQIEQNIL